MVLVGAAFVLSVATYGHLIGPNPGNWTHTDEWVYRAAGELTRRDPARLYDARLGAPGQQQLPFTYPPFAASLFAILSPLSFATWQVGLVVIDVVLLPVIAYLCLRHGGMSERRRVATALALAAVALWLEPVYMTMYFGQINLILLALVVADLALPASSRFKGIGIGIAAGLKLTPLIFVPYLFVSRRVRAAWGALGSFATTVVIGFITVPAASLAYWGGRVLMPGDGPERLVNQSLNGVFQRLLHRQGFLLPLSVIVAMGVAGIGGLWVAAVASRRGRELLGLVMCGATGLLLSPISWSHHWVWVIPGLALMLCGRGTAAWKGALGAAVLLGLFTMWPTPRTNGGVTRWSPGGLLRLVPHEHRQEYAWSGADLLFGNYYALTGLTAIALCAALLRTTRSPGPAHPVGPSVASSVPFLPREAASAAD